VQAGEVERLVAEWREEHPGVVVTTLRSAPVLGAGAERLPSRLLLGRPALRVRGAAPPVQATHVEDLVQALALVVRQDHDGIFNVASDGWLGHEEACALRGRSWIPPLPAQVLERALGRLWDAGLGEIPPGVVPYLVHPWVIANDRLEQLGWCPTHTNEEAILDGLDSLPPPTSKARLTIATAGALAGAVLAYALLRRLPRSLRRGRGELSATRPSRG
jgi:UDP-glucose 4-epimerase